MNQSAETASGSYLDSAVPRLRAAADAELIDVVRDDDAFDELS